ncbi:MAG: DUF4381 family protein [Verrucomicrobiaceae bacterium]|nr:MAG: DUF4381 family protein [Verrucomicrobiaceae bacterium]
MFYLRSISRPVFACCLLAVSAAGHLSAQQPAPEEDIRGPKPLVEIPVPKEPEYAFWAGVAGGALAVVVIAVLWKMRKRKLHRQSPREVALGSLSELESTHAQLQAEAFANRAAQTVRQYLADRFGLAAPRRTTEEFLHDIAREGSQLAGETDHLRVFLKSCDLAKFAGTTLNENQRHELVEAARSFIRSTSPDATRP